MHGEQGQDGQEPWGDDVREVTWPARDESAQSRVLRDVTLNELIPL